MSNRQPKFRCVKCGTTFDRLAHIAHSCFEDMLETRQKDGTWRKYDAVTDWSSRA